MALINTLMRLKDDGVVTTFDLDGKQKAQVNLLNGKSIVVAMSDDYVVGVTSIREVTADNPRPDYIVYNNWNQVTDEAVKEAQRLKIPLVKYGRFRYIIDDLLKSTS